MDTPFDAIMASLDPPMVIVTTADEDERAGCLVGFHSQSGMEPNSLTVWLSKANRTYRVGVLAQTFAVHFLTPDDLDLATLFGTNTGDDIDKFARCEWEEGPDGVPLLTRCRSRVVARKSALLETSVDHVCVVLDPIDVRHDGAFEPLRLGGVAHLDPGHEADDHPDP